MNSTLLLPLLLLVPAQDQHRPSSREAHAPRDEAHDYWAQVAERLSEEHSVAQVLELGPVSAQLLEAVDQVHVASLAVHEEESLAAIAGVLSAMTGLPILVDAEAENAVLDEGVLFDIAWSHPASVRVTLDALRELSGGVIAWTVRDGAVLVTTPERAYDPEIFLHPIADLTALFEPEDLATMILENVSPGSWELEGVAIELTGAFLTVVHDRSVQLGTEAFLEDLRAFVATLDGPPDFSPRVLERDSGRARLASVRFTPAFEEAPLADVAAFLQEVSGLNVLVSQRIFDELDDEQTRVTLHLPEMDVHSLLDLIVQLEPALSWSVVDGVLRLRTSEETRPDTGLALYDLRTIVGPAPADLPLPTDFAGGDEVSEALVLSPDRIEELIRNAIAPQSWDMDPANALRITERGVMVVNQSPPVQAEIRALLADLQGIAEVMLEVRGR